MDISKLFTTILQILIGCTIIYYILNFLKQKQKDVITGEIKSLEARMSSLRLILKAKVKKKSQYFRATSNVTIRQGDPYDLAICELADLSFDQNEQFEKYFSISKQLNNFSKIDQLKNDSATAAAEIAESRSKLVPVNQQPPASAPTADFMTADFKNEFVIIKAIHELIDLSITLKTKIDQYNLMNPNKTRAEVKIIQFPSVTDVQKIFSTHATDPKIEKSAA